MKRKIITVLLTIVVSFSLCINAAASYMPTAEDVVKEAKGLRSYVFPQGTVHICADYDGQGVTIFFDGLQCNSVRIVLRGGDSVGTVPGTALYAKIPASDLQEGTNDLMLMFDTGDKLSFSPVCFLEKKNGVVSLSCDEAAQALIAQNLKFLNQMPNPSDALSMTSESIRAQSLSIVGSETDPAEKATLIYNWITENIYYDYDYCLRHSDQTYMLPEDVLKYKRAVCSGISLLAEQMFRAVGIPCVYVVGYVYGAFYAEELNETVVSEYPALSQWKGTAHAWNAVFLDGEWRYIDVTFGVNNKYYATSDCWEKNAGDTKYLECDLSLFSDDDLGSHFTGYVDVIKQGDNSVPSTWAYPEVSAANEKALVPTWLASDYQKGITRVEFAQLMMALFRADRGSPNMMVETFPSDVFTDTQDPCVLWAYELGIVNGKGGMIYDPDALITRQEAATMLYRAARALCGDELAARGNGICFRDADQFAPWAIEGIEFVSSVKSRENDRAIMGGIGDDVFSPLGTYTREQAFLTMYRLSTASMFK